jgi:hypothetical protein
VCPRRCALFAQNAKQPAPGKTHSHTLNFGRKIMEPANFPVDRDYLLAFFFICCVAFVVLSLYQMLARNSKLTISELIKQKIVTISNINEIYISPFGARLKLGGYSFPLQRYSENYRNTFNNYIASIINEIDASIILKGKVDFFSDDEKKLYYSKIFYNMPWIIILSDAIFDMPIYILVSLLIVFVILLGLEESGSWEFSNNKIKFKYFFQCNTIDLSKVRDFELIIPSRKLEFELKILSESSTFILRDKKLKKMLPVVSLLNSVRK